MLKRTTIYCLAALATAAFAWYAVAQDPPPADGPPPRRERTLNPAAPVGPGPRRGPPDANDFRRGPPPPRLDDPLADGRPRGEFDPFGPPPEGSPPRPGELQFMEIAGPRPLEMEARTRDAQIDNAIRRVLANWERVEDAGARDRAKQRLRGLLDEQFELRQEGRSRELKELEERVAALRELHEKRAAAKEEIVARRLDQLLLDAEGLGWGPPGEGRHLLDLRGQLRGRARARVGNGFQFEEGSNDLLEDAELQQDPNLPSEDLAAVADESPDSPPFRTDDPRW